MPSAVATAPTTPCPHCNGKRERVTKGIGAPFQRCTSCGRDDRPVHVPGAYAPPAASSGNHAAVIRCTVKGCPGELDAGGRCSCCETRTAWAAEHLPARRCEICSGKLEGRGIRKLCEACKPLKQKAQINAHHAAKAKKK